MVLPNFSGDFTLLATVDAPLEPDHATASLNQLVFRPMQVGIFLNNSSWMKPVCICDVAVVQSATKQ